MSCCHVACSHISVLLSRCLFSYQCSVVTLPVLISMSCCPVACSHINVLLSRCLFLYQRAGLSKEDRTRIYLRVVRPTLEYACPVWHTGLPKYLLDSLEMIQKRALRSIYPGYHYEDILQVTALQTLAQRGDQLCQEYFNKFKKDSNRVHHLLPPPRDPGYQLRSQIKYPKVKARTDMFARTFIPWALSNYQ